MLIEVKYTFWCVLNGCSSKYKKNISDVCCNNYGIYT